MMEARRGSQGRPAATLLLVFFSLLGAVISNEHRGDEAGGLPHADGPASNLHTASAASWHPDRFKRHGRSDSCQRVESTPVNPKDLWQFTLSEEQIARSVVISGSVARLRCVLHKLQSGQAITVAVTGGSVTADAQRACDKDPDSAAYHREASWSSLVFNWINGTWPHPDHVFVKGAVPATGSAYFALCGDQHMPQKVDLALLEHGTNDVGISLRKTNLELYVRRVLTRSRRAKVAVGFAGAAGDAMVEDIERHTRAQAAHGNSVCGIPVDEAHSHSADGGVGAGGVGGNGAGGAAGNHTGANAIMDETAAVLVDWWVDRPWNFDDPYPEAEYNPQPEIDYNAVAMHYALSRVSARSAVLEKEGSETLTPGFSRKPWFRDIVHPNCLGHRVMADTVVGLLRWAALEHPCPRTQQGALLRTSQHDEPLSAVLHHIRAPLPDPLQPGNSEDFGTACRLGKDLQNAVVSNKGWAPEDLNGKFGLISEYAGAELVLDVGAVAKSLTVSFTRGPDPYFGDAEVSCEGGCACEPERIASFFAENQVRTMRQFFLQFKEPAPGCHLRFVAGQNPDSKGHRFKLLAIIVGGPTVDLGHQNHPAIMSADVDNGSGGEQLVVIKTTQ